MNIFLIFVFFVKIACKFTTKIAYMQILSTFFLFCSVGYLASIYAFSRLSASTSTSREVARLIRI